MGALAPAQLPTAKQIADDELVAPYTLRFSVQYRDVRTLAQKSAQLADMQARVSKQWRAQKLPDDVIASGMEDLRKNVFNPHADHDLVVTLSSNGKCILYEADESGPLASVFGHTKQTVSIFDGQQTYLIEDGVLRVTKGFDSHAVVYFPLPGVGLPMANLAREPGFDPLHIYKSVKPPLVAVEVPWRALGSSEGFFKYVPGGAQASVVDGAVQVRSVAGLYPSKPIESWQLSDFVMLKGKWLAKLATWTSFWVPPDSQDAHSSGLPALTAKYKLLDLSASALSDSRFSYEAYVPKGALVVDSTGKKAVAYHLQSGLSLVEQRDFAADPGLAAKQDAAIRAAYWAIGFLLLALAGGVLAVLRGKAARNLQRA